MFREQALDALNRNADALKPLVIITPKTWIWFLMTTIMMVAALIYITFGRVLLYTTTNGILIAKEELDATNLQLEENLADHKQKMNDLYHILQSKLSLYERHYLTLIDIQKARAEYIQAKEEYAVADRGNYIGENTQYNTQSTRYPLHVLSFVNQTEGKKIKVNMQAYILPELYTQYEHGYLVGNVIHVSKNPVTKQHVFAYLKNMELVNAYFVKGAPFMVEIVLRGGQVDRKMIYHWTSKSSHPPEIGSGSPVSVKIVTNKYAPYQLLLNRTD